MENGVTDRLWDRDVQEFIEACKNEKISGIMVGYSGIGSEYLSVSALYRTRRGRIIPIGYRWVESEKWGIIAEVYIGTAAAGPGAHDAEGFFRLAWKARLWWERKHVADALLAVTTLYFKAHAVRDRLQIEHLKSLKNDMEFTATLLKGGLDNPDTPERRDAMSDARDLALKTLNDLAHLYGTR